MPGRRVIRRRRVIVLRVTEPRAVFPIQFEINQSRSGPLLRRLLRIFRAGIVVIPLVAAGTEHHFEEFSDDLAVWIVFYGEQQEDENSLRMKNADLIRFQGCE